MKYYNTLRKHKTRVCIGIEYKAPHRFIRQRAAVDTNQNKNT